MIYIAPDLTDLRRQILKLVRPDLLKKELELERMVNDAKFAPRGFSLELGKKTLSVLLGVLRLPK